LGVAVFALAVSCNVCKQTFAFLTLVCFLFELQFYKSHTHTVYECSLLY